MLMVLLAHSKHSLKPKWTSILKNILKMRLLIKHNLLLLVLCQMLTLLNLLSLTGSQTMSLNKREKLKKTLVKVRSKPLMRMLRSLNLRKRKNTHVYSLERIISHIIALPRNLFNNSGKPVRNLLPPWSIFFFCSKISKCWFRILIHNSSNLVGQVMHLVKMLFL